MVLWNRSRASHIASSYKLCRSSWQQAIGFMGRRNLKDTALIFVFAKEKQVPLHMWFVFCSIDVYFLDSKKKVVEVKESFRPWQMYTPEKEARYVVEVPAGAAKVSVGDVLDFYEE